MGGIFSTKPIEAIRIGDLVLSRSEADPAAPLQLRPVTRLFRNVAYSIQRVTLLLAEGGTELLQVTAGHSFWVEGQGWTPAELLLAGQTVKTGDGRVATVLGSETVAHPAGIVVYNFSVEGDHTYFVDDGLGDIAAVWVHNKRAGRHHLWAFAWGNKTPRGSKSLTYLDANDHTRVHKDFSDFVEKKSASHFGLEKGYRFNSKSGRWWQDNVGRKTLDAWQGEFYRNYSKTKAGRAIAANIAARDGGPVTSLYTLFKRERAAAIAARKLIL